MDDPMRLIFEIAVCVVFALFLIAGISRFRLCESRTTRVINILFCGFVVLCFGIWAYGHWFYGVTE